MQELQSIEVSENEVLSDARNKAKNILEKADAECTELLARIDADIEKAKAEKESFYQKKLDVFEKNRKAAVPLEKQRYLVSFVQKTIEEKMSKYFESLTEAKKIEIVSRNFDFRTNKNFNAYVYGFDLSETKKFLEKKLGKKLLDCNKTVFRKIVLEEECGLQNPCGIILESEDKSIRARLTLSEIVSHLMDSKREELADALFGGSL